VANAQQEPHWPVTTGRDGGEGKQASYFRKPRTLVLDQRYGAIGSPVDACREASANESSVVLWDLGG